jgi:hypothetical protein
MSVLDPPVFWSGVVWTFLVTYGLMRAGKADVCVELDGVRWHLLEAAVCTALCILWFVTVPVYIAAVIFLRGKPKP